MKAFSFLILFIIVTCQSACATSPSKSSSVQAKFESITSNTQPKEKQYKNILVGIVTPFETKILHFGAGETVNEKTVFEIGSITKGFVGLLLAQAVVDGKLNLSSSFNNDTGVYLPQFQKAEISWKNLGSHTSGLPRVPNNLKPKDPLQPYFDYDVNSLTSFLGSFNLVQAPGVKSEYSNSGAGIVGLGLEKVYGKTLTEIFSRTITQNLNMSDTQIFLNSEQQTRITPVYLNGDQVPYWQWQESSVLQGAGALKSTMSDMIKFLKVMMNVEDPKLWPAVKVATKTTFTKGNSAIGLFWQKLVKENIVWHNGGTFGSSSFIGFDPDKLIGVVVLANSQVIDEKGVDPRLDLAAIETILHLQQVVQIDRPLKIIKDYDSDIEARETEFNKMPVDFKNQIWVKAKLKHMFDIDQIMRGLINKPVELSMTDQEKTFFQKSYGKRFYLMDWQNTQDMKQLLSRHGWFKISQWGIEADRQAWLLVQHADNDPEFQREVLQKLNRLYKIKETNPSNYAYLWDRVASSFSDPSKRMPQRYGTQGQCVGAGQWEPLPIEDEKNVDKRRKEVGLPTMAEYKQNFKEICK